MHVLKAKHLGFASSAWTPSRSGIVPLAAPTAAVDACYQVTARHVQPVSTEQRTAMHMMLVSAATRTPSKRRTAGAAPMCLIQQQGSSDATNAQSAATALSLPTLVAASALAALFNPESVRDACSASTAQPQSLARRNSVLTVWIRVHCMNPLRARRSASAACKQSKKIMRLRAWDQGTEEEPARLVDSSFPAVLLAFSILSLDWVLSV